MAQKNFYYIGIMTEEGMKFVTGFDKQRKLALWEKDKKPLAMSQQTAKDYAEALAWNSVPATVVRTFWELDNQPCWVMTEDEKNIDKLSSLVADVIKDVELRIANIWQKDGLKAAYNTDTDVISVTNNKGYVVRFEPIEYGENKEVTTYGIYPTAQMWELFSNTQGNRELFVEQLETKTEKTFVFCDDKGTLTNVNSRERYYDEDEELDLTQGNGRSR